MSNTVKSLRIAAGLTQAELAKKAHTSQQQIQRVEAGQEVKLDLALRLCEALGLPLEKVFPQAKKLLKKLADPAKHRELFARNELAEGGIDADRRAWEAELRFRNGAERSYIVSSSTAKWLPQAVQRLAFDANPQDHHGNVPFLHFEAHVGHVMLAPEHVVSVVMRWHNGEFEGEPHPQDELRLVLTYHPEPRSIRCLPDEVAPEDAESEGDSGDDDMGPIQSMCFELNTFADRNGFQLITDHEDDDYYIRNDTIAALEVPVYLWGGVEEADEGLDEKIETKPFSEA